MVSKTLGLLSEGRTAKRLDMVGRLPGALPLAMSDPGVQQEAKLLQQYFNFLVDLCTNFAWSVAHLTFCFPYCASAIFLPGRCYQKIILYHISLRTCFIIFVFMFGIFHYLCLYVLSCVYVSIFVPIYAYLLFICGLFVALFWWNEIQPTIP